jgi:hypothetical protein
MVEEEKGSGHYLTQASTNMASYIHEQPFVPNDTTEFVSTATANFSFSGSGPLTVPPIDLNKALDRSDLTFNVNLDQNDTALFSDFIGALRLAYSLVLRKSKAGDPDESTLIEQFLHAERLCHEQAKTDPRIPYLFAELLIRLDDFDYALDCLQALQATLTIPSHDVSLAISATQRRRADRIRESNQGVKSEMFLLYRP